MFLGGVAASFAELRCELQRQQTQLTKSLRDTQNLYFTNSDIKRLSLFVLARPRQSEQSSAPYLFSRLLLMWILTTAAGSASKRHSTTVLSVD